MMNIHLLKHALLLIVCFSTITAKAEHVRREVKVETAGTLSTIITEGAKYKITDLTIFVGLNLTKMLTFRVWWVIICL